MAEQSDIIIIGAGVVGSSVAMHLSLKDCNSVTVIDVDLEGAWSSSELNAGGVRATFANAHNVLSCMESIRFYESIANEVGFRQKGYLWLQTTESMARVSDEFKNIEKLGWPIEHIDFDKVQERFPFLNKRGDLQGAFFSPKDGLINPNLLKLYYRNVAKKRGVRFVDGVAITSCIKNGSDFVLNGINVQNQSNEFLTGETPVSAQEGSATDPNLEWKCTTVINCAGPWASKIADVLGYQCPSAPIRRQVSIFGVKDLDLQPYGMFVDSSGVYFHAEAHNGLGGFAQSLEPAGFNFTYDGVSFFEQYVWPSLYERSTYFENLKHLTGWAGLYEMSPDETGIIGEALPGVYECHSFSGHGVMQSYAAGRALAEKVVHHRYETMDFGPFSSKRFEKGYHLKEKLVI